MRHGPPSARQTVTPDRFRKRLAALGWSGPGFADLLGMDQRQVRRWAAGQYAVPEPVVTWLKKTVGFPQPEPAAGQDAIASSRASRHSACAFPINGFGASCCCHVGVGHEGPRTIQRHGSGVTNARIRHNAHAAQRPPGTCRAAVMEAVDALVAMRSASATVRDRRMEKAKMKLMLIASVGCLLLGMEGTGHAREYGPKDINYPAHLYDSNKDFFQSRIMGSLDFPAQALSRDSA
jgi:hypothetical protein